MNGGWGVESRVQKKGTGATCHGSSEGALGGGNVSGVQKETLGGIKDVSRRQKWRGCIRDAEKGDWRGGVCVRGAEKGGGYVSGMQTETHTYSLVSHLDVFFVLSLAYT